MSCLARRVLSAAWPPVMLHCGVLYCVWVSGGAAATGIQWGALVALACAWLVSMHAWFRSFRVGFCTRAASGTV